LAAIAEADFCKRRTRQGNPIFDARITLSIGVAGNVKEIVAAVSFHFG
jgi:hypothetical protein